MDFQIKAISKDGIPEAISKVELYRYLNEPGEAESICRDILAIDSENQTALRLLGLSITDQFAGDSSDRRTSQHTHRLDQQSYPYSPNRRSRYGRHTETENQIACSR